MNTQKSELYFLSFALFVVFVVTAFILRPFLYALILAVVFATVLEPLHRRFLTLTGQRKSLSAFLSTIFIFVVLIVPLTFLAVQIFQEATGLYSSLAHDGASSELSTHAVNGVNSVKNLLNIETQAVVNFDQYLKQGLNLFIKNLGPIFGNVAKILIDTFIFLIALYYLFKDGKTIRGKLIDLSPLENKYDETILSKLELAINSIVRGNLTVAFIQGILTAIGFIIFGVPSAALWGTVAAVAALIPSFGTSLVILPAVVYLFLSGNVPQAIGLLAWGMIAVGLIDNLLGPKLVGRGVQMHSFLILLSILGGISFFGPIGFLLGPLSLSLFLTLFEIYFKIRSNTNPA